jgi:hypothetical protein
MAKTRVKQTNVSAIHTSIPIVSIETFQFLISCVRANIIHGMIINAQRIPINMFNANIELIFSWFLDIKWKLSDIDMSIELIKMIPNAMTPYILFVLTPLIESTTIKYRICRYWSTYVALMVYRNIPKYGCIFFSLRILLT